MGVGPHGEERQFLGLSGRGCGQVLAAMTDLDGKEPGKSIDVAPPLIVPNVGAITLHDDRYVSLTGLVGGVSGEVHP